MQNGAQRQSMNEIDQVFGDRVVGRRFWPPRSPELNPCYSYLWGKLKDSVNNPPNTHTHTDELKDNIWVEISRIKREKLCHVAGNIFRRCEACLQAEDRHFEILL
jgi:hypothetical protein